MEVVGMTDNEADFDCGLNLASTGKCRFEMEDLGWEAIELRLDRGRIGEVARGIIGYGLFFFLRFCFWDFLSDLTDVEGEAGTEITEDSIEVSSSDSGAAVSSPSSSSSALNAVVDGEKTESSVGAAVRVTNGGVMGWSGWSGCASTAVIVVLAEISESGTAFWVSSVKVASRSGSNIRRVML